MPVVELLHQTMTDAGLSVEGVSIGRRDDKSTWRVDFADTPTDEQRASAASVIAGFDVAAAQAQDGADAQARTAAASVSAADVLALLISKGIISTDDLAPSVSAAVSAMKPAKGVAMKVGS